MDSDVTKFFELVSTIRRKDIALSPQRLSPLLGVSPDQFEFVGEWLLKDAHFATVDFELWLREYEGELAANFWLSDIRFGFEGCRQGLIETFGPIEYVNSKKGSGGWITYIETDILRPVTFIFDGAAEEKLYLEMVVVGSAASRASRPS